MWFLNTLKKQSCKECELNGSNRVAGESLGKSPLADYTLRDELQCISYDIVTSYLPMENSPCNSTTTWKTH